MNIKPAQVPLIGEKKKKGQIHGQRQVLFAAKDLRLAVLLLLSSSSMSLHLEQMKVLLLSLFVFRVPVFQFCSFRPEKNEIFRAFLLTVVVCACLAIFVGQLPAI